MENRGNLRQKIGGNLKETPGGKSEMKNSRNDFSVNL